MLARPADYLRPRPGELGDGEFFAAVAEQADCGILLDLHNLWCNERDGRQPVRDVLAELRLERVWEVHLAGGEELVGYLLDAHSPLPGARGHATPRSPWRTERGVGRLRPAVLPKPGRGGRRVACRSGRLRA